MNKFIIGGWILASILGGNSFAYTQSISLQSEIEKIAFSEKSMITGLAIQMLDNGRSKEIFAVNDNKYFPMQSVYKFPIALAVLDQVDKGFLSLEQQINLKKTDLLLNTWSPLRDKYPNGDVSVPLKEIIFYMVSQSDNNACDILLRLIGGPKKANDYIHSIGIKEIEIVSTEEEMHADWNLQFKNRAKPSALLDLLSLFFEKKILSESSHNFLWETMVETSTGKNRIKSLLPSGTIVAHKTGSSGTNSKGITPATNDIGIIQLPDGKYFAIVVLISSIGVSAEECEQVIAKIAQAAWNYYFSK